MSDESLKEFIQSNKPDFEQEKPSGNLWDRIETELDVQDPKVKKMVPVRRIWQVAAGMAAVFMITLFALQNDGSSDNHMASEENAVNGQFTNVEQLEKFYSTQVDSRIEQLRKYEVDDELLEEIALLKEEFDHLKNDADMGVNQEEILDSMIDNYRLRLNILEDIMKEMQSKNKEENVVQ